MLFTAFYRKRETLYIRGRIERFSIMWLSIVVKSFGKLWYIRHYPNIFFYFPFLQCTSICNYIVASNLLLVSLKKASVQEKMKENRQTMDFGVSAFSIDLAIVWILNFCVFVWVFWWECFYWCTFEGAKTNKTPFLADCPFYLWHAAGKKKRDGIEIERNKSCCLCEEQPTNLSAVCQSGSAAGCFNFHLIPNRKWNWFSE